MAGVPSGIPRQNAEICDGGVRANEEVWKREQSHATLAPVAAERRRSQSRARPRKTAALNFVHVKQFVECLDVWPWHKQFCVDYQVDMEERLLTAQLKLLNGPVVPRTCCVNAVNPDVGIYENPGTSIVAFETSGEHGAGP